MPLLQVTSNIPLTEAEKSNALQTLSKTASELLSKPEDYVMTSWTTAKMTMAGTDAPAVFLDLHSIRLPEDATSRLSKELCECLSLTVDVRPDRVFLNFHDVAPSMWGWNGKTFGD
ncbi:MAG: phenylpyruvate tautomerase MIF-related protein [Verrucomicrobiota bacterium]